jgi:hypothetical protein
MQISTSAASLPPPAPVIPMVRAPMAAAVRTAASTFGLDPLVGQGHQHVPGLSKASQLTGKNLFVAVVVADRRQCRRIDRQSDRRQRIALFQISAEEFCRQVLAVGGRAAISAEEDLVARAQGAVITLAAAEITPASPFSALKHDDISSKSA